MKKLKFGNGIKILMPVLFMFLFYQCMHDEFELDKLDTDLELNGSVLTPLAYGSLTIEDLISEVDNSDYISTNPDGLLYLTYEDSLFSYIADELLAVPNQEYAEFFIKSYFDLPSGWIEATHDTTDYFAFSFSNNEQLDSIILDQGDVTFTITSSFPCDGIVSLKFPNIILSSGDTLESPGNYDINDPTTHTISIDGATVILDDSTGTNQQFIPIEFHVELYDNGQPITDTDSIKIIAGIENLDFDAVFGYIGDYELITESGEIDLDLFDNPLDGSIRFENPQINFILTNSYGVPASVEIERLTGYKSSTDSMPITFNPGVNPFAYAYPKLPDYFNDQLYKDTTISISGSNSNISDLLEYMPKRLEYSLKATSNPPTPSGDTLYNFVTDESSIDVDFEFILPLWFTSNLAFKDTIDIDLEGISDDADIVEMVKIAIEISNGLPLDIDLQLFLVDSTYAVVDSLFDNSDMPIIESGLVELDNSYNPPGLRVTEPNTEVLNVILTGDDIVDLETVKYGIIRAGLKTPGDLGSQSPALFYSDYSVSFNISAGVNVSGEVEIE